MRKRTQTIIILAYVALAVVMLTLRPAALTRSLVTPMHLMLVGPLLAACGIFGIMNGYVLNQFLVIDREDSPVRFWTVALLQLGTGCVVFLIGLFL